MKLYAIILFFLIICVCLIAYPYILAPNGRDIEYALNLQSQIKKIIQHSGFNSGDGINVVMMAERHNGLAVAVKNPTPSENVIFDLIKNNTGKLKNFKFSNLELIFLDSNMKEVKKYTIKLNATDSDKCK